MLTLSRHHHHTLYVEHKRAQIKGPHEQPYERYKRFQAPDEQGKS